MHNLSPRIYICVCIYMLLPLRGQESSSVVRVSPASEGEAATVDCSWWEGPLNKREAAYKLDMMRWLYAVDG